MKYKPKRKPTTGKTLFWEQIWVEADGRQALLIGLKQSTVLTVAES
jgi:hypothetical protein